MNQNRSTAALRTILVTLLIVLLLAACSRREQEPYRIGLLGGLSGKYSSLGIDGRDGALLAIEQFNAAGGIDGRKAKLIIRDDRQDAATARSALSELSDAGVAAVIGPFTSSMAVQVVPLSNQQQLVTIGPTVSTNDLSNQDDYFLRVRPASQMLAQRLAEHIYHDRGIRRISAVYDLNNRAHSESWLQSLRDHFNEFGGEIVATATFNSAERSSFLELAEELLATPSEGVMILASSVDTGLFCQQLKKLGANRALFASEWSFTNDLLQMGGTAVEGMTIVHTFNPFDTSERFRSFSDQYQKRFGRRPGFSAAHAYDATNAVLAGLRSNPDPYFLKKALLETPEFQGLQTRFHLDRYGDAERELFLTTVENGAFALIETDRH